VQFPATTGAPAERQGSPGSRRTYTFHIGTSTAHDLGHSRA